MRNKSIFVISVIVVLATILASCAPAATPAPTAVVEPTKAPTAVPAPPTQPPAPTAAPAPTSTTAPAEPEGVVLPEIDPASLSGTVYSAGSSTVYPLSEAIAGAFQQDGFAGELKIDSIGSGGGFERFCKTAETDIANASRKIKDSEKESCAAVNRTPIEFRVGTDAIAIVVSKDNDFLTNVTLEELAQIYGDKAVKWSDVNPAWPSEDILRFAPGTDSGTFDFFAEFVIQAAGKLASLDDAKKVALGAKNLQTSEDDNVLVQGVEGSKYAIGYFGYAYYQNEAGSLKAVSINDITPSFETAESGEYLLSRPLFIYSDAAILKAKPQVAGFINYYLTNVNDMITEVGYFPASDEAIDGAKQALLDALK